MTPVLSMEFISISVLFTGIHPVKYKLKRYTFQGCILLVHSDVSSGCPGSPVCTVTTVRLLLLCKICLTTLNFEFNSQKYVKTDYVRKSGSHKGTMFQSLLTINE
jgi:hypothetical protein